MSTLDSRVRTRVWTAFILLTLIWGASFLWIKLAVTDIGPYRLVGYRLVFGLLGLLVFLAVQRPAVPRSRTAWGDLFILGLLNSALPWFLISWAEQSIDSAVATVLNGTTPLFTIVLAHLLLRDDRITAGRVVGLLMGFAGVVALSRRGGGDTLVGPAHAGWWGYAAMLGAAALYAMSGVFARRRLREVPVLVQAFYSMLFAAVLMWGVILYVEGAGPLPTRTVTWAAIVWLGVLGAGVAGYLFYFMLHVIGPTRASLITYTIPVVGVTLGVVVLKEPLDFNLVLGTVLIVAGVAVVHRRAKGRRQ